MPETPKKKWTPPDYSEQGRMRQEFRRNTPTSTPGSIRPRSYQDAENIGQQIFNKVYDKSNEVSSGIEQNLSDQTGYLRETNIAPAYSNSDSLLQWGPRTQAPQADRQAFYNSPQGQARRVQAQRNQEAAARQIGADEAITRGYEDEARRASTEIAKTAYSATSMPGKIKTNRPVTSPKLAAPRNPNAAAVSGMAKRQAEIQAFNAKLTDALLNDPERIAAGQDSNGRFPTPKWQEGFSKWEADNSAQTLDAINAMNDKIINDPNAPHFRGQPRRPQATSGVKTFSKTKPQPKKPTPKKEDTGWKTVEGKPYKVPVNRKPDKPMSAKKSAKVDAILDGVDKGGYDYSEARKAASKGSGLARSITKKRELESWKTADQIAKAGKAKTLTDQRNVPTIQKPNPKPAEPKKNWTRAKPPAQDPPTKKRDTSPKITPKRDTTVKKERK